MQKTFRSATIYVCINVVGLSTEVDIKELVHKVPAGATFTIFADSCNSGGLLEEGKEQIGPLPVKTSNAHKQRFMPLETIVEYLKLNTGIESSDIGTLLWAAVGDKASIKFHPQAVLLEGSNRFGRDTTDLGILLSACQASEMSGETDFNGKTYGIFTHAVQNVFKWHNLPLTNKELVTMARTNLQEEGHEHQHPCLYCSDSNVDNTFLFQPENPPPKPTA